MYESPAALAEDLRALTRDKHFGVLYDPARAAAIAGQAARAGDGVQVVGFGEGARTDPSRSTSRV